MSSLPESSIFAGRYRVVRCIAAGGMGAVYEVVHLETERRRALKVMHAHIVESAELRDRFKREARVAAQIDSEFIVDVFDAGVDEATQMPFLVMELLKGEELGVRLKRVGRLAPVEAITYLWQTALALDKTHRANVVHRDLKPENLFLTHREHGPASIKVLDFGIAKFVAETGTQGGATRSLGTPLYMAPEQIRGRNVTPSADMFALSMMAYTLLVGEPYWTLEASGEGDIVAFALKVHAGPQEPASARALRKGVSLPAAFDGWFMRATAADPAWRFPSATTTIAALGQVFGIEPARVTGFAASDPLPAFASGEAPRISGATPLPGAFSGATAPNTMPPGMTAPGVHRSATEIGMPAGLAPAVGTIDAGVVAPARRRKSSPALPLALAGAVALGAAALWFVAFRQPADEASAAAPAASSAPAPLPVPSQAPAASVAPVADAEPSDTPAALPSPPTPSASSSAHGEEEPHRRDTRSRAEPPPRAAEPPPQAPVPAPPTVRPPRYSRD